MSITDWKRRRTFVQRALRGNWCRSTVGTPAYERDQEGRKWTKTRRVLIGIAVVFMGVAVVAAPAGFGNALLKSGSYAVVGPDGVSPGGFVVSVVAEFCLRHRTPAATAGILRRCG